MNFLGGDDVDGSGTYPFVLFALGVELLLFDGVGLELFDRLLKAHHVRMGALVRFLSLRQLRSQLLVLLGLDTQLVHDLLHLLLRVAFLVHELECVPLPVLDPLEQLYFFLQLFVLSLQIDQLVLEVGNRPVSLSQMFWAFDGRDALAVGRASG